MAVYWRAARRRPGLRQPRGKGQADAGCQPSGPGVRALASALTSAAPVESWVSGMYPFLGPFLSPEEAQAQTFRNVTLPPSSRLRTERGPFRPVHVSREPFWVRGCVLVGRRPQSARKCFRSPSQKWEQREALMADLLLFLLRRPRRHAALTVPSPLRVRLAVCGHLPPVAPPRGRLPASVTTILGFMVRPGCPRPKPCDMTESGCQPREQWVHQNPAGAPHSSLLIPTPRTLPGKSRALFHPKPPPHRNRLHGTQ
ncbi:unnamed protein product [Nyctereutes procyonoides]|uniref:(raccoon dog) hypothetical protein n=1 Tax=Nyctereutes procyonoides TaxID=34880 RepID=A0A811ZB79_NYCPR|nr:unnamed protein product [Nyctereutes procyonoides]